MHDQPGSHRHPDGGFAIVELVVVLLIVAVLLGAIVGLRAGARSSSGITTVRATARAYEQVSNRFVTEHGGRAATSADWSPAAAAGPLDRGTGRPYLRRVPEASQGTAPLVRVVVGATAPVTGRGGEVRYVQGPARGDWYVAGRWDGRLVCASGPRAAALSAPRAC